MFLKVIIVISLICLGLVHGRGNCETTNCKGVVSYNKCYRLIYTVAPVKGFTLAQAHAICKFHGGKLAEIASEEQYHLFYNYIQDNWNVALNGRWIWVQIWLASKLEKGGIRLQNGNFWLPRSDLWHRGFPNNKPGHDKITLQVAMTSTRNVKGFVNYLGGYFNSAVPLCSFDLE